MTPPPRHPYDPGDPGPEGAFADDCALLVLLAAPDADPAWAARSAVSLARDWASRGARVFLADLCLTSPRLHAALEQPIGEGVSDLVLYGASLGRVARPADGFLFASSGTPVADARRVLASPRWRALARGFAEARAHLLALLSSTEAGASELLAHADRVLVLSGGNDALASAGGAAARVAGILTPRAASDGHPSREGGAAQPEVSEEPGWSVVGRDVAWSATPSTDPDVPAVAERPARKVEIPPPARLKLEAPPQPRWTTKRVAGVAAVAVIALSGVLAALGVIPLPWASGPEPAVNTATGDGPAAGTAPVASRAENAAPGSYFLTLGSYAEGAIARLQTESLGARRPDRLFVVSPVEVNGEVLHRLLVGETPDSTAAGLRESLARTLSQENPADWLVRPGPLSYHLGTFETLAAADARVEELEALEVPAFVLEQPPSAGAERFDVWAGAYADSTEAGYLGRTLNAHGIVPILVRRTGELPPR